MKAALTILGAFLVLDLLLVVYANLSATGYEEAFAATGYGALFGLPALGAFVALIIVHLHRRRRKR